MPARLLDGQPAKAVQLDKFRCGRVSMGQSCQRLVQREQPLRFLLAWIGVIGQFNPLEITAALVPAFAAGIVNQNMPHGQRRGGEEMGPPLPMSIRIGADQTKISFVYECGRLQCLPVLFLFEITSSQSAQFLVHHGQQQLRGLRFAAADSIQKLRNLVHDEQRHRS